MLAAGEGQAVLTASRSEQFSHYLHKEQRTFFGEALVQALRGAGPPPLSGLIGLYELYQQVYNEVSEAAAAIGEKQEPMLTILQGVGPFPVAHYRGATATDPSLLQPAPPALPSLNLQSNAQIAAGARWISFSFSFTIHTGINSPPNSSRATLPFTQTATPSAANTARYRSYIIEQVRRQWIDGLLQHSLGQKAKIALTYQVRLDLVEVVLAAQVQELQRLSLQPEASTSPAVILEQLGGAMLIVGAAGGGKTTLLLEVARELLGRAVADMRQSVPVVFNLSSWGKDSLPLEEWLTRELNRLYDVPLGVGRRWIDDDALIAMLDGLDEVAPAQRPACVDAINTYRGKHSLGSIVVCCRAADYAEIGRKVRLNGALVIQPLSEQQIEGALSADGKLAALRAALEHDSALRELATSPLMLSVMALAYESLSPDSLARAATVEERRQHLFDVYITNMLERGSAASPFNDEETRRWLSWLAFQMAQRSQTIFFVEGLQPDWLPGLPWRVGFHMLALLSSLAIPPIALALGGLLLGGLLDPFGAIVLGRVGGATAWMLIGVLGGMVAWLIFAAIGVAQGTIIGDVETYESVRWSWRGLWAALGVWGVIVALGVIQGELWLAVIVGFLAAIVAALSIGLRGQKVASEMAPNQGTWRSLRNGGLIGLVAGVPAIAAGLATSLVLREGLIGGLVLGFFALSVCLGVGLTKGGGAFVKHFVLRALLALGGHLPLALVPFLNYCTGRLFLRRIGEEHQRRGAGYIFAHRLLLEHFAALHAKTASARARKRS